MNAIAAIGWRKMARFLFYTLAMVPYGAALFPPVRRFWLALLGARVGAGTILHDVRFFNLYRRGLSGLHIGRDCFIGNECLFDLAEGIVLEDQVTLAERVMVLTHMNVGYADHPLQARFPATAAPVTIRAGSFVGAGAIILAGRTLGPRAFVAAGSVVTEDVPADALVAGVPARVIRQGM